jgi:hypothetical protein
MINFHLAPMTHWPKVKFLSVHAPIIQLDLQSSEYKLPATSRALSKFSFPLTPAYSLSIFSLIHFFTKPEIITP